MLKPADPRCFGQEVVVVVLFTMGTIIGAGRGMEFVWLVLAGFETAEEL